MRFNYDLLPGELLSFEEIALRYAQQHPGEKALTARGLLSPPVSYRQLAIRALFAQQALNSPLEELLFISDDNEHKNYLRRFERYLKTQQVFLYFRRSDDASQAGRWKVMGESRVYAMLDPHSAAAQNLLTSRGYRLVLMRQQEEETYWQLFDAQAHPCFPLSRAVQFIVVLSTPQQPVPAAVMPGTEVGRRVKTRVLQHASQAAFLAAVKARYGACVITGTPLTEPHGWPWVEACHINTDESEAGLLADNSVDNGLFLRSDLQRLFRNKLISIDGETGQVMLSAALESEAADGFAYQPLAGKICALWPAVPPATRQRLQQRNR